MQKLNKHVVSILKNGGIGVLPTDTLYGLVGSALNRKAVRRIYTLRRRNPKKPMIILIGSIGDLKRFGVALSAKTLQRLKRLWPGPISVILPLGDEGHKSKVISHRKFLYLHRGTKALAFRLPKPSWLRTLLAKVGPIVAPSANPEGKLPARTIKEAKRYFGDKPDFYVDGGKISAKPSRLIKIEGTNVKILRR